MLRMNLIAKNLLSQSGGKQDILSRSYLKGRTLPRLLDVYNYKMRPQNLKKG